MGDVNFLKPSWKNHQTSSIKIFQGIHMSTMAEKTMVRSPASTKIPGAPGSSWRPPRGLPPPPAVPPLGRAAPSGLGPEWRAQFTWEMGETHENTRKMWEEPRETGKKWEKLTKKNLETIGTWDIDRNPAKLFNVHQTRSKICWSNHVETLTTQISEKKKCWSRNNPTMFDHQNPSRFSAFLK